MPKHKIALSFPILLFSLSLSYPALAQSGAAKPGTATVSGRVTLKSEPAPGVAVALLPQQQYYPPNPSTVMRAKTDETGRFRFTGVTAGRHYISALAPGFAAPSDNYLGSEEKSLNVSEGENIEDVVIELKRGGVITGRVTDAQGRPLTDQGVAVTMIGKDGAKRPYNAGYSDGYIIDDRGVYRVYGLPEGRYLVSVGFAPAAGRTFIQSGRTFYPRTFHPGVTDESEAKVIEVTEGSEKTGADISVGEVKKTCEIAGRVVNADTGQPAPGVELAYGSLRENGQIGGYGSRGERSDANGEFQLTGVMPGKYAIFVRSDTESDLYSEPAICDASEGDVSGVEVKIRPGASISGVVVIEGSNDPAVLSKLSLILLYAYTRSNQPGAPSKDSIRVNADGRFQIRGVQPGKVDIWMYVTPAVKGLSKLRIEHNGVPQRDGIELDPGEHATDVRFVVGHSVGIVRGQVKIVGGELPQDLTIYASAKRADDLTPRNPGGVQVDARGQFLIENLTPGEYELQINVYSRVPGDKRADLFRTLFSKVRERVIVSNAAEARATLVIDLSR
jgi:hypothetical protein